MNIDKFKQSTQDLAEYEASVPSIRITNVLKKQHIVTEEIWALADEIGKILDEMSNK